MALATAFHKVFINGTDSGGKPVYTKGNVFPQLKDQSGTPTLVYSKKIVNPEDICFTPHDYNRDKPAHYDPFTTPHS